MKGKRSSLLECIGLNIWWQQPKLRTDEDEDKERRATWMELFYDLIYVAVIGQLSHKLSANMSLEGVLGYAFLFVPVWLIWLSSTYYNERFEIYDVRHRIFTFLKMIPIAGLAYSVHDAFGKTATVFAFSYIFARVILIYMWWSAGEKQDRLTRKMTRRFALGSSISVLFWVASIFLHGEIRFILWGIGLLIELMAPVATMKIQSGMTKLSFSHISERFGLFSILAMAETVIGVVNGIARAHHFTLNIGATGVLGLALAFAIWWVYFDHVIYRPFRYGTWTIFAWSTLHLPITIGITAIGASLISIISHEVHVMDTSTRLIFCGSVGLILLVMGIIGMLNEKHDHQKSIEFNDDLNLQMFLGKAIGTLIIVAIAFFGRSLNPLVLLSVLVLVMIGVAVQGLCFWVRAQMPEKI